jgi:ArsR family transcriptional regulator, arsenate/arsenite/antimonite-responsive transcriptional repressor
MIMAALSALAEPTRLDARRLLTDGAQHRVCDLMRKVGATQIRMPRHMHILKQVALGVDRRDARWVRFRIRPDLPPHLLKAALVEEVAA